MSQLDTILKRRSIRSFSDKEVEEEKLEKILKAAVYAPTAKNRQPLFFVVVKDGQKKDAIIEKAGVERNFYHAPVIRFAFAREEDHLNELNLGAAIENARLEATDLGVSSCWIHSAREKLGTPERRAFIKETLNLKKEYPVLDSIALGYASASGEKTPRKIRNFDEDKII